MYSTLILNMMVNLNASASIGKQRGILFEVFHPEVLPLAVKIPHVSHEHNILFIYKGIYVRATCFDVVGHRQVLPRTPI